MDTAEKSILFCFLLQAVCCRDFNISLPQKIEALSGSCVIIKCRFEIQVQYDKNLTERATGQWFKNGIDVNNNLVFNSSTSSQNSFMKGNITGKLKDKDCTTVFHDLRSNHIGQYYFRIEGEGGLKWTYTKTSVSIHVIDSPPKPKVQLYVEQKKVQDHYIIKPVSFPISVVYLCFLDAPKNTSASVNTSSSVLEGSSVTLTCSGDSNPAVLNYTWSRESEGQMEQLQLQVSGFMSLLRCQEDESSPVYVNNAMLSPTGAVTQNLKELHYASIDFTNIQPESEEIRGVSSLTTDYAVVQCYPGGLSEAESSIGGDQLNSGISAVMKSEKNQTILEQERKMGEVFSQPSEDTTYENITI
ncbi:myelin-associated glycoprotein-like [Sinocyclocheilus rhinocerous]|uniref:myelin-associated glycoprotein-like n=1 Tax=Sinocyclocheilus rhinocerous TaxID=307959 RepID=UPI0007BA8C76|nr:PREDICTED: myelin-associated glycoprotein-like [Sinocyclocheilus rhinocerous]